MLGEEGEAIALRLLATKKFQKTESRCCLSPNVLVHALRGLFLVCAYVCMYRGEIFKYSNDSFPGESRLGTYVNTYNEK